MLVAEHGGHLLLRSASQAASLRTTNRRRPCRRRRLAYGEAREMKIESTPISEIKPYEHNPRRNDDAVDAVAASIREFGFRQPIVVDENMVIIVGHTRWKAAVKLGLAAVPVHVATGLSPEQAKAYRLADNRSNEFADWDFEKLLPELDGLDESLLEDLADLNLDGLLEDLADLDLDGLLKEEETRIVQHDVRPPPAMTWVLIGVPTVAYGDIAAAIEGIASHESAIVETTCNDG